MPSLIHTHNTDCKGIQSGQCLHWQIFVCLSQPNAWANALFSCLYIWTGQWWNGGCVDTSAHVWVSMPRYWESTLSQPFCTCVQVCKHSGVLIHTVQTKKMFGLLHDNAVIIIALVKLFDRSSEQRVVRSHTEVFWSFWPLLWFLIPGNAIMWLEIFIQLQVDATRLSLMWCVHSSLTSQTFTTNKHVCYIWNDGWLSFCFPREWNKLLFFAIAMEDMKEQNADNIYIFIKRNGD